MKKQFLHFYDKMIIAIILGILALFGCAKKTYPEKNTTEEQTELKQDSLNEERSDTLRIIKDRFKDRVIAMYGVRPSKLDK